MTTTESGIREPIGMLFSANILVNTEFRNQINSINSMAFDNYSVPCRLSEEAGFARGWFSRVNGIQTTLNVRKALPDEKPHSINGILTAFYGEQWLESNRNDSLWPLDHQYFEAAGWQNLPPKHIPIWVYLSKEQFQADRDFPILQSAIDEVILGYLEYGEAFAIEFLQSTSHWSQYWLNDRHIPRRPWVHQPKYELIDRLLEQYPSNRDCNQFKHRKLDSQFATYFVNPIPEDAVRAPCIEDISKGELTAPKHFIFGFGSLINTQSRMSSDDTASDAIPVRVLPEAGLYRSWNFQSPTAKLTALGLGADATNAQSINGVVYPCDDIEAFDQREAGYVRKELTSCQFECLSWKRIPEHAKVWVYVPESDSADAPLSSANRDYPILQSYIDLCILGCLEYGEAFAREFLQSTSGWSTYWLNDRQIARRPWVHQPKHQIIDGLLREVLGEDVFNLRKLDVEFSALVIKDET